MASHQQAQAEKFKAQGNDAYKKGEFALAIRLYEKATHACPKAAVYLSNLSAAQYEDGLYAAADESIDKALPMLFESSSDRALRSKLLLRQAKSLLYLHRLNDAKAALEHHLKLGLDSKVASSLLIAIEHLLAFPSADVLAAKRQVSTLPRYRYPQKPQMTYYVNGHDEANSLLQTQYNVHKNVPDSESRLRMSIPKKGSFEFAGLFAGIGDARNLYATLIDIGQQLKNRHSAPGSLRIHLTMIDQLPTVLARNLVVLYALNEISHVPLNNQQSDARVKDLLLMLHFLYWAVTMPPKAHRLMMTTIEAVTEMLQSVAKDDGPLDLPWIYMESGTVHALLPKLRYWLGPGQTAVDAAELQEQVVENIRGGPNADIGVSPDTIALNKRLAKERMERELRELRADGLAQGESVETVDRAVKNYDGLTPEEYIEFTSTLPGLRVERMMYNVMGALTPPRHADEPAQLQKTYDNMRLDLMELNEIPEKKRFHPKTRDIIRDTWRVNCTYLDEDALKLRETCPDCVNNPFQNIKAMFETPQTEKCKPPAPTSLYDYSASFFSAVADALRQIRDAGNGAVKIEAIAGDAFRVMDQIRFKSLERHAEFPTQFDRVHASNVPDYIGGYLASFTTATPLLKDHPAAYFTANSMLLANIWENATEGGPWNITADSQIYTYTATVADEAPKVFGVQLADPPDFPAKYFVWTLAKTPKRLSRAEITKILVQILFKTALPPKYQGPHYRSNQPPRLCLNVQAFFRLLYNLGLLGYPAHHLGDLLDSMLENRVAAAIPMHALDNPIPLSTRQREFHEMPYSMAMLQTELSTAAALWRPLLPFPILALTPAVSDLVRCSIYIGDCKSPVADELPVHHATQFLAFAKPADMNRGVQALRPSVMGDAKAKSSFQLLSTYDWDHEARVATFLLPNDRAREFRENFEVGIVDCACWRLFSRGMLLSLCADMVDVGDANRWDKTARIGKPKSRPCPKIDFDGLIADCSGRGGMDMHTNPMAAMMASTMLGMPPMPDMDNGDMEGMLQMMQALMGRR